MHVGMAAVFQNPGKVRPDQEVYRNELRLAELAEPLGFESIWGVEHHFTDYTMCPDVLQFLTYMAGRTERAQLGSMVVVLPWHDPIRVAELKGWRLPGIADAECKTLQRQSQDVGECLEGGGEGRQQARGQLCDLSRGKQADRRRLVDGIRAGALLIFPLASKLHPMRSVLPGEIVGEDVAAKNS